MKKSKLRIIKKISNTIIKLWLKLYYQNDIFQMKYFGKNITLSYGIKFDSPKYLYLGDNIFIGKFVWFSIEKINQSPSLIIKDNAWIGDFTQINCVNKVIIGKNTLIASRCYIGDVQHNYSNKNKPIKEQGLSSKGSVIIGDDCWIGSGAAILSNVKIGKHCVIGANSVVTKDIPDFSIAVGNPAKVIKKIN